MSSTGIVNFEDATIQAVEMYATDKMRIGVSSSSATFAVGGDIEIVGNINITGDIIQGSTIISGGSSGFNAANTLNLTNSTTGLIVDSNAVVTGNVTANYFVGDGSNLTGIVGGSGIDTTQTLALSNVTTGLTVSSNAVVTGNVTANYFVGDGSNLTGIPTTVNSTDDVPEGSSNLYYTDSRVNAHLNISEASGGQVLSWNGSDYAWTVNGSGGLDTTQTLALSNVTTGLSVSANAIVTGNVTASVFLGDGGLLSNIESQRVYVLATNGSSDYIFQGPGFDTPTNDPVLRLIRGFTYIFDNRSNYTIHPFKIRNNYNGSDFTRGVIDDGAGMTTFTVPMDAPSSLYYQCSVHSSMGNIIHILSEDIDTTQTLALSNVTTGLSVTSNAVVTGNVTANYFVGDGSQLTGVGIDTTQTLALSNVTTGLTVSSNALVTGNVTADYFVGDGSNLTGISGGSVSSPFIDQYGSGFSNVYSNAVGYVTSDMVATGVYTNRSTFRTNDDGTIFAMGVPAYNSNQGCVMLYSYVNDAWSMEILDPSSDPSITSTYNIGSSVDVSDNGLTVIASSYSQDNNKGIAFVWRRDVIGGNWTMTKLQPTSLVGDDKFGHGTICTNNDGTLIFIGAFNADVDGAVEHGKVFKFELSGSSWTETEIPAPGSPVQNYSRYGLNVSCNGDGTKLAVGVYNSAYIVVLEWDPNTSAYIASFPNFNSVTSGYHVSQNPYMSADGNVIVTGGYRSFASSYIGEVVIMRWDGSSWIFSTYSGDNMGDYFGITSSVSNDGSYIVIGSYDGNAYSLIWNGSSYDKYTLQGPAGSASFGKVLTVSDNGVTIFALDHTNATFFQLSRDVYKNLPEGFEVGTSNLYVNTKTGNVGINTNNPQYELEVNGVVSATQLIGDGSNITSVAVTSDSVALINTVFNICAVSKNYMGTLDTGKLNISNVLTYNGELVLDSKFTIPQTESSSILNSNVTAQSAEFGRSVDISADGTRMIVGSPYEGNNQGKVQVFDWNGTSWVQVGADFIGTANYYYGYSVAISPNGNLIAIGDSYDNQSNGSVYVYERSGSVWNYLGNVEPSSRGGLQKYGYSVDITNNYYLVASTPRGYNDVYTQTNVGEVYTFEYSGSGTTWNQRGSRLMGSKLNENCGEKVSLSDDGMVLALSGWLGAYVYRWSNSTNDWVLIDRDIYSGSSVYVGDLKLSPDGLTLAVGNATDNSSAGSCTVYKILDDKTLKIGNTIPGDTSSQFGASMSFNADGSILAVSSPYYNSSTGRVKLYKFSGTDWEQLSNTLDGPSTGSVFGKSIAMTHDATKLIVGVPQYDTPLLNIGAVYVYEASTYSKLEVDYIYGDGSNLTGISGGSSFDTTQTLALSNVTTGLSVTSNALVQGDLKLLGSMYHNDDAVLTTTPGSTWTQLGLDIDGEESGHRLGWSVSLSADATRMAIGVPYSNSAIGHTGVYEWSGSAWTQLGLDIDGEAETSSDESGQSVSLSADGTRVAIGAHYYYYGTGRVRVYELPKLTVITAEKLYAMSNIGIGTTTPAYALDVVGDIYASGTITQSSDIRRKSNLHVISEPVDKLNQIHGYTYDMDGKRRTGLVAQEVLEILPEAVIGSEQNGYGLAYGDTIGLLVEAIKELNKRIVILENN